MAGSAAFWLLNGILVCGAALIAYGILSAILKAIRRRKRGERGGGDTTSDSGSHHSGGERPSGCDRQAGAGERGDVCSDSGSSDGGGGDGGGGGGD